MFSQSLCFGENTLQEIENGAAAALQPPKVTTPNRSYAIHNSDSDIIEESPTNFSTVSLRERTKSKSKKKKAQSLTCEQLKISKAETTSNSLSQCMQSKYDFSNDILQISPEIDCDVNDGKNCENANVPESAPTRVDNIYCERDMFDDSIVPMKFSTKNLVNEQKENSVHYAWGNDDSLDLNDVDLNICETSEENNAKELNLKVDDHIALGVDNVTFTQNFLNEASFENDLNMINGPNTVATSKFIEEEMESCKQSFHEYIKDECQQLSLVSSKQYQLSVSNLHMSQLSTSTLNMSQSSFKLNYSQSTEESEEFQVIPTQKSNTQPLQQLNSISSWGLPSSIVREYHKKGIVNMFDWQKECLMNPKVLCENANLVYCAPTSAGKTLVSEILLIKNVLEKQKKVLVILPFVSVAREKMIYLQDLLTSTGVQVEGYFGGYSPRNFENVHVAVCTIEKANSIMNKLLEQNKIHTIGCVVVDEVHLISDASRGYILELLLAKILYVNQKFNRNIQVIAMSATLPNLDLLTNWLRAEFYHTDFRPVELKEMIKVNNQIFDNKMQLIRSISDKEFAQFPNDPDNIGQLCVETILESCSAIVFCPSKDWCEDLAKHLAAFIHQIGKSKTEMGGKMREQINFRLIEETKAQLRNCPTGLDSILENALSYGCAFHHAGLTSDERDIIENAFKTGSIRVIMATSTLSSGVNLPARRVIIRSPLFGGKTMNALTYKQMIGRAGRTGKDTLGESILMCNGSNRKSGETLISATLKPLASCLDMEDGVHLKRALLEIIASGMASTKTDLEAFCNCTLLSAEKQIKFKCEIEDKQLTSSCGSDTRSQEENQNYESDPIGTCLRFLLKYEFVRTQMNDNNNEMNFISTRLGNACLASSMAPGDGFLLFSELQKARQSFVLETELHAIYLVTPLSVCYQMQDIDWMCFLDMWEKLPASMRRVGEMVGVKDIFFINAMRGRKLDFKTLQIHKRFYTSLALQELVNEKSVTEVAHKFKCSRGVLQTLQQLASTFAGIVTSFCNALNWTLLTSIISQFKERLFFGVHQDLVDLMKIPNLNSQRARSLFNEGIQTLADLANSDLFIVEKILYNSICFDTKQRDGENEWDAEQRNNIRFLFVTGKSGLTIREAAVEMIENARQYLEIEMKVKNVVWSKHSKESQSQHGENDNVSQSKRSPKVFVSQQSSNLTNTQDSHKRKLDDGDHISPDNGKRFRGISPLHSSEKLTDQFTLVSIKSAELLSAQSSNISQPFEMDTVDPRRSKQFMDLNIINVFGSLKFFNQFKIDIANSDVVGVSVGVNRKVIVAPVIGPATLINQMNSDSENLTGYNCSLDDNKFIAGISLCLRDSTVYYLNLQNERNDDEAISFDMKIKFLVDIFYMEQLTLVIVDAKEQCKVLAKCFPQLKSLCTKLRDPFIANWILQPDFQRANLLSMVRKYAPYSDNIARIAGIDNWSKSIGLNCENTVSPKLRSSVESCIALHIMDSQMEHLEKLNPNMVSAFTDVEMPIQRILFVMEIIGFPVEKQKILEVRAELADALKNLETQIYNRHGRSFDIKSSKEVAKVVGLVRNGRISTSNKVLARLNHPVGNLIMKHRTVETSLKNTIQPLILQIVNSRIHPRSSCFTLTGRISMHEPNLQNVTKDFEINSDSKRQKISCRRVFQVRPENELISADFCQLELRILTHYSNDQSLTKIMRSNDDIFKMISAKWNNISESDVTEKQRNYSKKICYGIIYGMGVKSLAESMECDEAEAQRQQALFHKCYPGIRAFADTLITRARECGFVETICGRRRYLPHLTHKDSSIRAEAERQALSTTIQGSGADIAKCAMLEMDKRARTLKNVHLVLHVHDELVYEAPKSITKEVVRTLKSSMENCMLLNVPLQVKLKTGRSWGTMSVTHF